MGLYDKIKKDDRHENCIMLSYMPIKEKTFPSWHMGSKEFDSNQIDYKTNISTEDKVIFSKLLSGTEADGSKTKQIIQKFFK